jgi:transposase-like protein
MVGHGAKFGHKREEAIAVLLSYRSVEEAARAIGISASTLLRWMKQPEFEAALREARHKVFSQAIERLQNAADAAAKTVLKIMLNSNTPTGIQLRAAEIVLDQAAKAGEIARIEARVARLERPAGLATKSRKRSADLTCLSATSLPGPATTPAQIAAPAPGIPETAPPTDNAQTDEDE